MMDAHSSNGDESARMRALEVESDAKSTAQRRAYASTFDRLVESNLSLTGAVSKLVLVSYILLGVSTCSTLLSGIQAVRAIWGR